MSTPGRGRNFRGALGKGGDDEVMDLASELVNLSYLKFNFVF